MVPKLAGDELGAAVMEEEPEEQPWWWLGE